MIFKVEILKSSSLQMKNVYIVIGLMAVLLIKDIHPLITNLASLNKIFNVENIKDEEVKKEDTRDMIKVEMIKDMIVPREDIMVIVDLINHLNIKANKVLQINTNKNIVVIDLNNNRVLMVLILALKHLLTNNK